MAKVAKDHIMAAVVGSAGSGMTTIVEAVLHRAGAIPRPGTIAEGNTVSDFQPEEVARQTTLTPSLTYLDWTDENGTDHAVTLADTPGHPDFIGGVDSVLSAADLAVIVVSAVAGVTAGTRAGWAAADAAGRPRIVLITCADRPQADFRKVLKDLRNSFGDHLFAVQLPIGEEENFTGIADVLSKRAMSLDANGKVFIKDLPSDIADEAEELHMEATENIVENDEDLMMAYLEGEEPSVEDLEKNLAEQVAAGNAVPVIVASGVTETGVDRFIDVLCRVQPQVSGRDFTIIADDGTEMKIAQDAEGEPILYCFQTVADKYGQVSVFRVLSGTVRKGDKLRNATTGTEERLGDLFRLRGSEHIEVDSLSAGDVGGVAKLKDTPAASLLWSRSERATAPALPTRAPVFSVVLKPATQADTEKLSTALQSVVAEDPTLTIDRKDGLTILRGLGDTHINVTVDRLKRVSNVDVTQEPAPVAYLETIGRAIEMEGKVKKQSGGSGQFAVVQLKVAPLASGEGFQFIDSVVGGSVPRNYIPAVEKGARMALERGGPNGFPIVDISVELYDGKSHSVDSSDMAFQNAALTGVKAAMEKAGSVVLEPIDTVHVTVPMEFQGAVMQDLSGRRGRVQDTQMTDAGDTVVIAQVPEAELGRYVLDLRSFTQGHAQLTMEPSHYERLQGPLPESAKKGDEK